MATTGRPKSRRVKALENKIKKLGSQVELLQSSGIASIDTSNMDYEAVGIVKKSDKTYELLIIKLDIDTGVGKLVSTRPIGDSAARAMYEFNKYMAREYKIKEKKDV